MMCHTEEIVKTQRLNKMKKKSNKRNKKKKVYGKSKLSNVKYLYTRMI